MQSEFAMPHPCRRAFGTHISEVRTVVVTGWHPLTHTLLLLLLVRSVTHVLFGGAL